MSEYKQMMQEELDEIKERFESTTPGFRYFQNLTVCYNGRKYAVGELYIMPYSGTMKNFELRSESEFISNAYNDISRLLAEVEFLRGKVKQLDKEADWLAKAAEKGGCLSGEVCPRCPNGHHEKKRCYGRDMRRAAHKATSMATASAAVRQRDALADKLGEGKHYKTVRAIPWLLDMFAPSRGMYQQVGKKLTAISARMGYEVRTVEDSKWGTVKAYHVEAIEALRLELAKDVNMLGKYRKA